MALEFIFGSTANCSDGVCGQVTRTILDPAERTLTHLVIEPGHNNGIGRLVPIGLVDSAQGEVSLSCTRAQFDQLDAADVVQLAEGRNYTERGGADSVLEYRDVSPQQRGHKDVAIPADVIASMADGIELSITKKQVEDLPAGN
jgi:hypothetical protein